MMGFCKNFCQVFCHFVNLVALFALAAAFNVALNSVRSELDQLQSELSADRSEIHGLHALLFDQMNKTLEDINTTVTQAQTEMHEEVQSVNQEVSTQGSLMAYQFAGTFTILGSFVSVWHMSTHLRNFHQPFVQRKILAILWMSPIYGVTSWLSLVFVGAEGFLAVVKDLYEAYCIYIFLSFLVAVLGRGDRGAVVDLLARHAGHLKPPIRFFGLFSSRRATRLYESDPRAKAEAVLHQCQVFALQFVLVRPLTSIAMAVCNALLGKEWDYHSPQFYIMVVTNVSVCFAFSGLLKFYHAVQEDLKWCRPFPKFLCIKGVVFMTFWQGVAITVLATTVYSRGEGDMDEDPMEWSKRAQNFLICLEMFFFAVAHCFVFPTEEWEDGYRPNDSAKTRFGDNIALRDFVKDVKYVMKRKKSTSNKEHNKTVGANESCLLEPMSPEDLKKAQSQGDYIVVYKSNGDGGKGDLGDLVLGVESEAEVGDKGNHGVERQHSPEALNRTRLGVAEIV